MAEERKGYGFWYWEYMISGYSAGKGSSIYLAGYRDHKYPDVATVVYLGLFRALIKGQLFLLSLKLDTSAVI